MVGEVSWRDGGLYWGGLEGIVVVAYAVYCVVACFSESEKE